ncbi:unnamed protein product [Acanthocheilonema viteae]|uniref:Uncharacterized protein n=1 Tax=Acanthocheilonema viteae TaxID=6277 RepID=A0A498SAB4_ACAVI|nr:unnamed protein product [Acanthocheilonema viteae]
MEGALLREPTRKGNFFSMHINLDDYVKFLKNALASNKTMFMVSRDPRDHPSHRLVGIKAALPELIKDYEVNAKRLSVERQLSAEQIDYAALGYFSNTEGNSFDHGLPHDHEHYHDRGVHTDSHEHIRIVQHTSQPIILSSEATTVPAVNVAMKEPQEASIGTVTSVYQQEMPLLESEFRAVSEIPTQQNLMHGSVSPILLPDSGKVTSESVMHDGLSSAMEGTSKNIPPSVTTDINLAAESSLPQIESSQEKTPLTANIVNVNAQNLLHNQPLQSMSVQQVNIELPPQQVMTIPSPVAVLDSSLPPTLDNISQINFSASSVNVSLSNISSQTGDSPSTPSPSVVISDVTPPILVNSAHSDSVYLSSAPSSPLPPKHIKPEKSPSDNTATILKDRDILPVSVSPHTEPITSTFITPQFDPVTLLSEFGSTVEMELESRGKDVETTTVNYPLEPPPFPSTSIQSKDSILSYAVNPSATESILYDEKDYCVKDECDSVYNTPRADEKLGTEHLFIIRKWLSKLIDIARFMLPSSINNFDDAGAVCVILRVLVTFFVPLCLFIHLLRMLVFADTCDRDHFDRRILHNALTTIRQREIQIMSLHAEMEKGKNTWNTEMDEKFKNLQSEISQLKAKCRMLEEENDNLKAEMDETSQMVENERLKCKNLMDQNRNLGEKNELLTKQSFEIHATMEVLHEENERLVSEVAKKSAQLIRLESEANSYSLEIKNLKDQLKTSLSESKILRQRVEELQNEIVQLSEIINEIGNSGDVAIRDRSSIAEVENGEQTREDINGESGWSDFDEFDVDNPPTAELPEKPKKDQKMVARFSPAEIMEVAKLRVKLKTVEADLDQAKLTLQKELNERDHLMRKVEFAEAEAAKRLKEVDTKEAERVEAQNQFKRILGMVEEREAKLRSTEELIEKMRDEVMKWQEEVRRLEDQKKAVEFKLLEAEQELKRLKAEYTKLETRSFHEIRQCKQTVAALQQQSLEQVHLSNPSSNLLDNANVLNISASSSDRDYGMSLNNAPPLLPHIRPLWNDERSEIFSSHGESSLLKKIDPLLNDVTSENGNISHDRGSKQRRSIREREHNIGVNMDGMQPRHKKAG